MNLRKNFEAVFLVAAVVATSATYAVAEAQAAVPAKAASSVAAAPLKMHTVVVKAHRLSAAEKAALN